MDRKLVYIFGLVGFFLLWGVFGFAAAVPRGEPGSQATVPPVEPTVVIPEATAAGIPVTGEPEPVWKEIVVFYGLIGLTALFLILRLLRIANRSNAPYVQHKGPPSDNAHTN
jgi:hypothetical protein